MTLSEDDSQPDQLLIGGASCLPIAIAGSSAVQTPSLLLALNNILCTPKIAQNLLFVPKFTRDNSYYFQPHAFHFSVKGIHINHELLLGQLEDGLY